MMSLLVTILLAILIVAVLFYAIGLIPGLDGNMANLLRLVILIGAVIIVIRYSGVA